MQSLLHPLNRPFWPRIAAFLAFILMPGGGALAQCQYEVVSIIKGPFICSGGSFASFFSGGLDEQGNAAGWMSCGFADTAAIWSGGETAVPPTAPPSTGQSRAFDLVDPDHVVGKAFSIGTNTDIAAFWEFGQGRLLPNLPDSDESQALGITTNISIVGYTNNSLTGPLKAVFWEPEDINTLLLPLGPKSVASDINISGQIAGWMGDSRFTSNAFIWTNGVVEDLGKIPGGNSAEVVAINNSGHVVGRGWIPDEGSPLGEWRAFHYDGSTMIDLGTLPDHLRSTATDINDANQIVGSSSSVGGNINISHAVLWQDGQMYNLDDLNVTDLGGGTVLRAVAINNAGQILVTVGAFGVILEPIGSGPGDIDNNCIVNVSDLLMLLGEWGKADSIADINKDGTVSVADLLELLTSWG